jgi:hypothetical protein
MAEELTALISRVLGLHPLAAALKTDVNLVLANFFPWITNRLWSGLSVFEQVILLQSRGYASPIEVIGRLFLQVRPHLLAVIFHGGPDFVHLYASEWISTYVDADPISPPVILFSVGAGKGERYNRFTFYLTIRRLAIPFEINWDSNIRSNNIAEAQRNIL